MVMSAAVEAFFRIVPFPVGRLVVMAMGPGDALHLGPLSVPDDLGRGLSPDAPLDCPDLVLDLLRLEGVL